MSHSLPFDVIVVIHELDTGHVVAYPAADPGLSAYGDENAVLSELGQGLAFHLSEAPAAELSAFMLRAGAVETVAVELDRQEPGERRPALPMAFELPVFLSAEGKGQWVRLLTVSPHLNTLTFHLARGEDLAGRLQDELGRAIRADGEPAARLLELVSQNQVRLHTLRVMARRPELAGGTGKTEARKKLRDEQDRRHLGEIGTLVEPGESTDHYRERAKEEKRLRALFAGKRRLSAVVVGERGVGKTTLIHRLRLLDRPLVATSGAQWVAGQSMVGQLEQRVQDVLAAAERLDVILYFETLDELFSGRGGASDLAAMVRPWLEQERVRVVVEVDPARLESLSRAHAGFFGLLHTINLAPMTAQQTRELLTARSTADSSRPVASFVDQPTAEAFVELVSRYFPYGRFPGQAISVADELAAGISEPVLDDRAIHVGLSEMTGIPEMLLRDQEPLKLQTLQAGLRRHLIGQDEALNRLAHALCSVKARLQPEGRPLAVLLFVGPTGVGKTQAARALARLLYGFGSDAGKRAGRDRLIRFDMSEYSDPWSADRLIRGTDRDEGLLTRQIRREPFSVLLLDEIEKAHDAVFDLLLQVFGEGRLSDAKGRTAYFHNCLIILTSNLGAAERRTMRTGFARSKAGPSSRAFYEEQVQRRFRPELINRLDHMIAFEPLSVDEMTQVAAQQIESLSRRQGFDERALRLRVDREVSERLAREAYAPEHGARALRRHLQRRLVEPVGEWVSQLGSRARDGELRVSLAKDGDVGRAEKRIAEKQALEKRVGALSLRLIVRTGSPKAREDRSLPALQTFRRQMRSRLAEGRLLELSENLELVHAQLHQVTARKESKKRDGAVLTELSRLRHRLMEAHAPLEAFRSEVEEAEELALVAYATGEPIEPWTSSLDAWRRRWSTLLPAALLARERPRHELSLLVEEPDAHAGMAHWLPGLPPKARALGWTVRAWPVRSGTPWYGQDPVKGDELSTVVQESRDFRAMVVEVRGPEAGGWLAAEGGLHRFLGVGPKGELAAHVRIRRVAFRALSELERRRLKSLQPGRPVPEAELNPQKPDRLYDVPDGRVLLDGDVLPVPGDEYWTRYEEVLAAVLLRFEDDQDLDRTEALFSQELLGGAR